MPKNKRSLLICPRIIRMAVLTAAVSALTLSNPRTLRAQVVIKDTIVISPGGSSIRTIQSAYQRNPKPLSKMSSTGLIMPFAGNVTIEYDSAYSLTKVIDPIAHVTAKISGHTFADTSITGRLRLQNTTTGEWNFCTAVMTPDSIVTRYEYDRDTTHPSTEWRFKVFSVLPNEQVELACTTLSPTPTPVPIEMEGVVTSGPDTVGQTLVWRLYFQPSVFWTCDPAYMFNQYIYLSLVLSPDTVVRFSQLDSNNVYPYIPSIRNDTVTVGVKKRYVDLEAKIAYGDSAMRNYPIRVHKPVLVDSGGHSHDSNRPLGTYRVPKASGSGFDIIDSSFTRNTDTSGVLKFRFLGSQFGGKERIKARTVSDTTKFDTLSVKTRVPGLLDFSATQTNLWNLTGAPPWSITTTYYRCPGDTIRHYKNHYVTLLMNDRLQTALSLFFAWSGTAEGGSQYLKVGVNDMSLAVGGMFDICSNWQPGHGLHREGTSVDIDSSSAELFSNPGHFVPLQSFQIRRLTELATNERQAFRVREASIHYEFRRR